MLDALQIFDTPQVTKGYLYTPSGERLVEIDWSEGWVETWSLSGRRHPYFFRSATLGIAGQRSAPQRPCQIGFEIVRVF